jgi:lysozyme
MLRCLQDGDFAGASAQFPLWDKAGGQVLVGLVRRRLLERTVFDDASNLQRPP